MRGVRSGVLTPSMLAREPRMRLVATRREEAGEVGTSDAPLDEGCADSPPTDAVGLGARRVLLLLDGVGAERTVPSTRCIQWSAGVEESSGLLVRLVDRCELPVGAEDAVFHSSALDATNRAVVTK